MFDKYIQYFKNNPQGYWFKRKLFGWGWMPVKWQGWFVVLVYIALILALALNTEKDIPGNPDSGSNFLTLVLPIFILTVLLFFICYKKGEKPRWQWGLPEDKNEYE